MSPAAPGGAYVPGSLTRYLVEDHERLDGLLRRALERPPAVDMAAYDEFRRGLLRHIGIEEKLLFPAAQRANGGEPLPVASRLRLDHGALAALLVPPPTAKIIGAIRTILVGHNRLEDEAGGAYEICERLMGSEIAVLAAEVRAFPPVPVSPHVDDVRVVGAMRRALARAGYNPASLGL